MSEEGQALSVLYKGRSIPLSCQPWLVYKHILPYPVPVADLNATVAISIGRCILYFFTGRTTQGDVYTKYVPHGMFGYCELRTLLFSQVFPA